MVRRIVALACLAGIAGCGGSSSPTARPASTPTPAPAAPSPVGARRRSSSSSSARAPAGATLDTLSVRVDGTATHEMRYGGAGGRFRDYVLRTGALARIRRALAEVPPGSSLTRGSPPPGGAQYLLRSPGPDADRPRRRDRRRRAARVTLLDGVIDGGSIASSKLIAQTHTR